jgi:glutathione S-transferase
MILYYHPLSSYCWKVLIAFYESGIPFERRMLEADGVAQQWQALWPLGKFPVLRDPARDTTVAEASIIIEYAAIHEPGTFRPIPADPDAALETRLMDRLFDNYVMAPMQALVLDRMRPEHRRDSLAVEQAGAMLGRAYALIEGRIAGRTWAAGDSFTLADCAAAPSLFYADKIVPLRSDHPALAAYLDRLLARPSFARVLEEKEPWWSMFPFADGPLEPQRAAAAD